MTDTEIDRLVAEEFANDPSAALYVNHAAMSPWPRVTRRAVEAFARENHERGPLAYAAWLRQETALREQLERLLNASAAADIALLPNTSAGVNIVAQGLPWRAGDNLVTAVGEFPTNQLAWERLSAVGVAVRRVDLRASAEPEQALLSAMDGRTRLLTVSSVQWTDGFRLDLAALGSACAGRGVRFFVDAIQQLGALRLDVQAAHVDGLAAGSHKWQMGPEGMGVFYCSAALRDELALRAFGWRMLADPYRFGAGEAVIAEDARRFEPGSPNLLGQQALAASLGLLEQVGMDVVEERVLENSGRLFAAVADIPGLVAVSDERPGRRSGIVTLQHRSADAAALNRALKLRGVSAVVRGGGVRLSPHFYQHGAAMDRLLNALEDAAGQL